jgi:hypothetical protein
MSEAGGSAQAKEVRMKLVAVMQPVRPPYTVDVEGGYSGSKLGNLLKRMAGDKDTLTVTRQQQEYVRGLADGGMLYASNLYDMLAVCPEVVVTFKRVEAK